jgi:hypothetical protein
MSIYAHKSLKEVDDSGAMHSSRCGSRNDYFSQGVLAVNSLAIADRSLLPPSGN